MLNLYPFFFRFGISFNYTVSQEDIQSVCEFIINRENIDACYFDDKIPCDSINISDEEAEMNSDVLAHRFLQRIEFYNIKDFNNSIFFIDAKNAYSDKFYEILFKTLEKLIQNKNIKKKEFPIFFILINSVKKVGRIYDFLFDAHLNNDFLDYCLVFDPKSNFLEKRNLNIYQDPKIKILIHNISTSDLNIFLSRLIRKINHFKIDKENRHSLCQLFFYYYEITNYENEPLYRLLLNEFSNICKNNIKLKYIIYDSDEYSWLIKPIISLSNTLESVMMKHELGFEFFGAYNLRIDSEFERFKNNITGITDVLFISGLINTGDTFKRLLNKLSTLNGINLHCFSILITEGAKKMFNSIPNNDSTIIIENLNIKYLHKVKQQHYLKIFGSNHCPYCKFDILPSTTTNEKIGLDLSALEMWQMCSEAGFKLEDFVPSWRKKTPIIPNSIELFKLNSPLLAYKFEQKLKEANFYSREVVIIYPDERETSEQSLDSTPSGCFVKCLNRYNSNFTYLEISRNVLNDAIHDRIDFNNVQTYENHAVIEKISKIFGTIVVIDEVNLTTGTFEAIYKILRSLYKYPKCYFPIFNFNVNETLKLNEKLDDPDLKFLSLYEFDIV